jgi:hypothetical protein
MPYGIVRIAAAKEGAAMARWPDFFIVGAQRAGTTSLHEYLRCHPDIVMPILKETHFFGGNYVRQSNRNRNRRLRPMRVVDKEGDYLKLFQRASAQQIIGEACPTYMPNLNSAGRIKEKAPDAQIIILLRDPVDRAYSHYLLETRAEKNPEGFYESLVKDYERLSKSSEPCGLYVWPGLYEQQVRCYLESFGREQVRIYLYEDLAHDTFGLVRDVCSFLGVEFNDGRFFDHTKRYNTYVRPRNSLLQWVVVERHMRSLASMAVPRLFRLVIHDRMVDSEAIKPPLDPRAQEFLHSIYDDDILKLQELIGRDLSNWTAEGT